MIKRSGRYEINGGLIFIGTVVSIILFIGTFLMMYYKNVAEGYEDRKNYQIMQHVGIDNDRIKDTINKQIIWIFALPLLSLRFMSSLLQNNI